MNCRKIELFRLPQYSLTRSISGWRKWQRSAGNKPRQACLVVAWHIRDETYSKTLAELVNFADRICSLGIVVWICFFCDSKIGERHTKMCDQTGFRRIHLDCRPETLKCTLLDSVLNPFRNRYFREGRNRTTPKL